MIESWIAIVERYQSLGSKADPISVPAIDGIHALALHVQNVPGHWGLYGWTSMFDLCIQQTDIASYSGPYLRVSPLPSGMVGFRFIDTMIADRQWHREVPAAETVARFDRFLQQVHWRPAAAKG